MKTTIEMNEELFRRAKAAALADGVTLRELIENGVRSELNRRQSGEFALTDASFEGKGTQSGVTEGDWSEVSGLIYAGRGG